MPIKDSKL